MLGGCTAGNDVHESAKNLSVQFEAYYKQHYRSKAPAARKSASPAPGIASPALAARASQPVGKAQNAEMEMIQRKMEEMQRELDSVQNRSGGGSKSAKKKSAGGSAPARKNMTFEEKRTLSLNIGKLSHDKLGKVAEIIKKRKKLGDAEEFEIDIDSLAESTLRELEKYANECLNPTKAVRLASVYFPFLRVYVYLCGKSSLVLFRCPLISA